MRGLKLYLIISGLLVVIYVVAEYYRPKPTDWEATYLREDKIPFGLYILNQEIGSIFPNVTVRTTQKPVYNTLKGIEYRNTNYLMVAGNIKLDKLDFRELDVYLRKGNDVFIATFEPGKLLRERLKLETNTLYGVGKETSVPINFVNPTLKRPKNYVFDKGLGDQYFSSFDTSRVTVLGKNKNGQANFIRYAFGKGNLYLLPNPQLLTNYNLINLEGADYAAKALSYLKPGNTLIWDERFTRVSTDDASVLRVIFKNDQLRWAYYISLISMLVFIAFEIKRRQRIIPLVDPMINSSVEFVKVVGTVYYQQRNNTDISQKKINYFLEFIRSNYRLKTQELDDEFVLNLIQKSGMPEETINTLVQLIREVGLSKIVTDQQLISLNKSIEQFYQQVR